MSRRRRHNRRRWSPPRAPRPHRRAAPRRHPCRGTRKVGHEAAQRVGTHTAVEVVAMPRAAIGSPDRQGEAFAAHFGARAALKCRGWPRIERVMPRRSPGLGALARRCLPRGCACVGLPAAGADGGISCAPSALPPDAEHEGCGPGGRRRKSVLISTLMPTCTAARHRLRLPPGRGGSPPSPLAKVRSTGRRVAGMPRPRAGAASDQAS